MAAESESDPRTKGSLRCRNDLKKHSSLFAIKFLSFFIIITVAVVDVVVAVVVIIVVPTFVMT